MNWTTHPYLYQVCHPWHWLTYKQNFAAFASLSSFLVAAATLWVVFRQTNAAHRQATASEAQVESAREASKVSLAQLEATKQSAAAEKLHGSLIYLQLLDSLQPSLAVVVEVSPTSGISCLVENQGHGIAKGLRACFMEEGDRPILVRQNMIAPGNRCELEIRSQSLVDSTIGITYQSQDGRNFLTRATFKQGKIEDQTVTQIDGEGRAVPFPAMPNLEV